MRYNMKYRRKEGLKIRYIIDELLKPVGEPQDTFLPGPSICQNKKDYKYSKNICLLFDSNVLVHSDKYVVNNLHQAWEHP